jgi:hypothetical protein
MEIINLFRFQCELFEGTPACEADEYIRALMCAHELSNLILIQNKACLR